MKKRKLIMMFLSMFLLVMCISQINSAETSAKEAKYKIKTETAKYKDKSGKVRGIVSFQYPQFEEPNTQIKYINKTIKTTTTSIHLLTKFWIGTGSPQSKLKILSSKLTSSITSPVSGTVVSVAALKNLNILAS